MKTIATIITVSLVPLPALAAGCNWGMKDQTAQISCAAGQAYDEETRSCVPTTS